MLYVTTAGTIKFSILSLYDRLFGSQKRFRLVLILIGVFVLMHTFVEIVVLLFQCKPVHGAWDVFIQSVCVNIPLAAIIMGSINVVVDFVVLFLPMPLVWNLNIQKKWKVQLVGIFLLGGLSVARLANPDVPSLMTMQCLHMQYLSNSDRWRTCES